MNSDPGVLGKQLRLESYSGSRTATVVGVLEPSVPYPVETEIISNIVTSPHHLSATMVTGREHRMTEVFGRLAPGATLEQARAELRSVYAGMLAAHPDVYRPEHNYQIGATRLHDQINSRANTVLWVLVRGGSAAVRHCLLERGEPGIRAHRAARRRTRGSHRAGRQSCTIASRTARRERGAVLQRRDRGPGVGGADGQRARPLRGAFLGACRRPQARPQLRVVRHRAGRRGFHFPGLHSAAACSGSFPQPERGRRRDPRHRRERPPPAHFRGDADRGVVPAAGGGGRVDADALRAESTRPPYNSANVLAVNLPVISYGRTPEQIRNFDRDVKARVAALPGVESVATRIQSRRGAIRRDSASAFSSRWKAWQRRMAWTIPAPSSARSRPDFFNTMGMPLLEGRDFRDTDKDGAQRVVIISQSLANTLFPGQEAIGREIRWTDSVMKFIGISYDPRRIVGVVPDVDDENIIPAPAMTIYQPVAQEWASGRLFVRAKGDPYALVPAITRTIHEMDGNQPVERASTLNDIRAEVLTPDKLNAVVFGGFAAIALLISVVGVAGVLAFSVSGRTREFGIRIAMGAQPRDILASVLREGLLMAGIGVAAGVVVGFAGLKAILRFVSQIHMPGILTTLAAALVIVAAAVIASAIPALRAARVNAVEALRAE